MIVNKDETSQIKTDEPTTSGLLTVEPSTDAARQETVDVNRVMYDINSNNNTMITTVQDQRCICLFYTGGFSAEAECPVH